MSVSRFSETLAYTPDLNKLRDEIISTLRFYEEKYSKIARLQAPRQPLTDERIVEIALPFVKLLGGHWENEHGIAEAEVELFARAIEQALLNKRTG